jgi:hypothetical protein
MGERGGSLGTYQIMKLIADVSPRSTARLAGAFYVLAGAASVIGGVYIPGKLVVPDDAAASAKAILAHQHLFELGFSLMLIAVVCSIVLTALFYGLFKPVNRNLSVAAAFFHLVGLAILSVASLLQLAPLVVLQGGPYLNVFKPEQVQALAYLFLQLNTEAGNAFLAFFGLYCVLIGYLIFRSTFLPRTIGVFMAFAGLGYLTFVSPPLAVYLSPYNLAPAALGEGSLMIWLLAVGVNPQRWKEQAATRESDLHKDATTYA